MKSLLIFAALLLSSQIVGAGLALQKFGEPLAGENLALEWNAPTNSLPQVVKVFRVVPTKFPDSTITNLLRLAGLNADEKKRPNQIGVFTGKDVVYFGNRAGTKNLGIVPAQGYIVLENQDVISSRIPRGVPNDSEAISRALDIFKTLNLQDPDLAFKPGTTNPSISIAETTIEHFDKVAHQVKSNVSTRAVMFYRRIGTVPVMGINSFSVTFGENSGVAALECTWRSLQAKEQIQVPRPPDIIRMIKSGKSILAFGESPGFSKLTILKAEVGYLEYSGSEVQELVYPFFAIEAQTENSGKVHLYCPMMDRFP